MIDLHPNLTETMHQSHRLIDTKYQLETQSPSGVINLILSLCWRNRTRIQVKTGMLQGQALPLPYTLCSVRWFSIAAQRPILCAAACQGLAGRHPDGSVQADNFAVEHGVLHDAVDHLRVFGGIAQA